MGRAALFDCVDAQRSALIVIDVQNDFCAPGAYFDRTGADLSGMEPMIDRLQSSIEVARRIGVMVVFVRSDYDELYLSSTQNRRRRRVGWDEALCGRGSWGFEFYRVSPRPGEAVVTKHRYDAFYGTELELILNSRSKRNLIFAGVATNVCVETSLRSAFVRDFEVVLLADCTAARTPRAYDATLETVGLHFGVVATSGELERAWIK